MTAAAAPPRRGRVGGSGERPRVTAGPRAGAPLGRGRSGRGPGREEGREGNRGGRGEADGKGAPPQHEAGRGGRRRGGRARGCPETLRGPRRVSEAQEGTSPLPAPPCSARAATAPRLRRMGGARRPARRG